VAVRLKFWLSLVGLLILLSSVCSSDEIPYSGKWGFSGDLKKPEQVLAYLMLAPKVCKKTAEKIYDHAQKQTTRIAQGQVWGAVAESGFESLMVYPTGKAFLLMAEGYLRECSSMRQRKFQNGEDLAQLPGWTRRNLDNSVSWFDSAIAVEAHERSLDETGRDTYCTPLQWAGV
jgi:hypothetical protein